MARSSKVRTMRPPSMKLALLTEYENGEETVQGFEQRIGLPKNSIHRWKGQRNKIEKQAKREAQERPGETIRPPKFMNNGKSNGHAEPSEKPKLQILGLTPLIEQLVREGIRTELPKAVAAEMDRRFSRDPS